MSEKELLEKINQLEKRVAELEKKCFRNSRRYI